ncbi:MAG: hypothetical protein IT336_11735 [Thermomicrobiales bacterium]|nr:hypothetical protein [Thermomicrobiales bacterium]
MSDFRLPLRVFGLIVGLIVGITAGNTLFLLGDSDDTRGALISFGIAIGGIGYLIGPQLSRAVFRNVRNSVAEASTIDIIAIGIGLAFGALISAALALPLSFLPDPAGTFLPILAAAGACGFSVAVVLMRKRDLISPWFRPRHRSAQPGLTPAVTATPAGLILDTNVVIDGRIGDVLATGFIDPPLIVPRFVLDELQYIADSDDPGRRVRGRRGLDALNKLRAERPNAIEIVDDMIPEERDVDAKLVRLAKRRNARVLTNDVNLNRVAQLQDVKVLNLNELTSALRPLVLPGDEISLKVTQEGREL